MMDADMSTADLFQRTDTFVTISLPGQPRGKGRPRFGKRGSFVSVWTDPKTMEYENALKAVGLAAMRGSAPRETAISVNIIAAVEIPASWSRKKRQAAIAADIAPTGKPDYDNIAKIVGDALNGIVWKDDSQIVACTFVKFYSEMPGLRISAAEWLA
jgi:Holliday junction resolvase RusA-like endonuclease